MPHVPDDFHLQLFSTSPAPKRDYHGLTVTREYVTLNSWDISRGKNVYPRKQKVHLENFPDNKYLQNEIEHLFGRHVLDYILRLVRGERNLQYLPEGLMLYILRLLAVNDILHLRQTSKIFFEVCNTNSVWKILYKKRTRQKRLNKHDLTQGEVKSWKYLLKRKLLDKKENAAIYDKFKKGLEHNKQYDKQLSENIKKYSKPLTLWTRLPDSNEEFDKKINIKTYKKETGDGDRPKTSSASKKISQTIKPILKQTDLSSKTLAHLEQPVNIKPVLKQPNKDLTSKSEVHLKEKPPNLKPVLKQTVSDSSAKNELHLKEKPINLKPVLKQTSNVTKSEIQLKERPTNIKPVLRQTTDLYVKIDAHINEKSSEISTNLKSEIKRSTNIKPVLRQTSDLCSKIDAHTTEKSTNLKPEIKSILKQTSHQLYSKSELFLKTPNIKHTHTHIDLHSRSEIQVGEKSNLLKKSTDAKQLLKPGTQKMPKTTNPKLIKSKKTT